MERFRRRSSQEDSLGRLERALSCFTALRKPSPSRTSNTKAEENGDIHNDQKGPLGLNLLHRPEGPLIDFIFVHGLGGGSRKSWSRSTNSQHFWPKEWLSRDPEFSCVRVHSFGYKADWFERKESVLGIHDFARSLLSEIEHSPEIRRSNTKIVFIAHSMGGIVAKQAYLLARQDPSLKDLAYRFHSFYFLATPHRGSDFANTLSNILRVSYGSKPFVSELLPDSISITSINDSFRHVADDVQLWSFYEALPSNLILTNAIVVDKASAILGYSRERTALLNADHRSVCKFELPTDPNYKTLRNALATTVDSILSEGMSLKSNDIVSHLASQASRSQFDRLTKLIGVSDPPVDDLSALDEKRVEGSCEWATSTRSYESWRTPWSSSRPILWFTGHAASGKSVICSYVVNELQKQNQRCGYFFFRHGDVTKSSISGCLRALAFQMATSDVSTLDRLTSLGEDAPLWDIWDERTLWRKLFLGCIFKEADPAPQYWVIDALDECQKLPVLLSLFAKVPSYLRIFFTSRITPEVEQGLTQMGTLVEHRPIHLEDTIGDFGKYIDSKMDRLPVSNETMSTKLKSRILSSASGSFLWVSLIVQELEHAYSEEGAEEILNDIPSDMNRLYDRMLSSVPTSGRASKLARAVFSWATLSFRALTINEMQAALKLDTNDTVQDLIKTIPTITGQLIFVDHQGRICSIHQTAKMYLLQQDSYPILSLQKHLNQLRMAEICLRFLIEHLMKGLRQRKIKTGPFTLPPDMEFVDYASLYFSDHLQKVSSEDEATWSFLCEFLGSKVLLWLEYLAITSKLHHVPRTAKNLKLYLRRRVKYMTPLDPGKDLVESWINDLVRLNARFRSNLTISPSSIHTSIPAMCPSNSIISKTYATRQRGILIKGLNDQNWDDCLSRIDFHVKQTSAVAHGDRHFAVGLSSGRISIYSRDSFQEIVSIDHGERIIMLTFSDSGHYIASSGPRYVRVWNVENGTQSWTVSTPQTVITLLFSGNDTSLAAATHGNCIHIWDIADGQEQDRWPWFEAFHDDMEHRIPHQPPQKAVFSSDSCTLAVSYRGLPIYMFDTGTRLFIGCCGRTNGILSRTSPDKTTVDAMSFNPSPEINKLVVSYQDGALGIYDIWSMELRRQVPHVFAHSMACSPDGRTLVTGSARGTVQIFEFGGIEGEKLSPIYRIDAFEEGIKGMAFSNDSIRFTDIRGSQCRVWEPAVLLRNKLDIESQSEISQTITLAPSPIGMLEGPPEAEIATVCALSGGEIAFCGKQDGLVTIFDTQKAIQMGELYRHGANAAISTITFYEPKSLLASADESGRILINEIILGSAECKIKSKVSEFRQEQNITNLIIDPSGTKILLQSKGVLSLWMIDGKPTEFIMPFGTDNEWTVFSHPMNHDQFVCIGRCKTHIFSWNGEPKVEDCAVERARALSVTVTPPSPEARRPQQVHNMSISDLPRASSQFIVKLLARNDSLASSAALEVWPTATVDAYSLTSPPLLLPGFDAHVEKIRQIIAVVGSLLLFLDNNLWICSLDFVKLLSISQGARRHFFLLSEWQSNGKDFIIEYVAARREFLIVKRHELLVVKRGLEVSEPWSDA